MIGATISAGGGALAIAGAPTVVGGEAGAAIAAGGAAVGVHGLSTAKNGLNNLLGNGRVNADAGSRKGKTFSPKEKEKVLDANKQKNNGKLVCEDCGVETTKPEKSQRGVTPPKTDLQVDHIQPKSKGGSGTADNGQVLCRDCNRKKSDK